MTVAAEFPQLAFTAANSNQKIGDEARRALNEIRALRRATSAISLAPPPEGAKYVPPDDGYHDKLRKVFALPGEAYADDKRQRRRQGRAAA